MDADIPSWVVTTAGTLTGAGAVFFFTRPHVLEWIRAVLGLPLQYHVTTTTLRQKQEVHDAEMFERKQEFLRLAEKQVEEMRQTLIAKYELRIASLEAKVEKREAENMQCREDLAEMRGRCETVIAQNVELSAQSVEVARRAATLAGMAEEAINKLRVLEEKHPEFFA